MNLVAKEDIAELVQLSTASLLNNATSSVL